MKFLIAIALSFAIGFGCKWLDIPAPAPPMWQGALLVVAMTLGYSSAGWMKDRGRVQESREVVPGGAAGDSGRVKKEGE